MTELKSKSSSPSPPPSTPLPLFRRKRSYLLIILSLLTLILYLRLPPSTSSPFSSNNQRTTHNLIHSKGPLKKPTKALEAMALQQGLLRPVDSNGRDLDLAPIDSVTINKSEKFFLLFQALKNKDWRLTDESKMLPKNGKEMVKAIKEVGETKKLAKEQISLYKSSPTSWLSSQRSLSPLTIFSKSYCPYSKKAKNLLHSLGANYQVYEIDLREDGEALQPFLAKLSGHRTFPTVFLQDTLIGGWDDLEKLRQDGILEKLLREAGAV